MSISNGTTTVLGESPRALAELVAQDEDFDFCTLSGEQLTELYSAGAWWRQGHRPGVTRLHALLKSHSIPYVVYYVDNKFGDPSTWVNFGDKSLPILNTTMTMIFDALVTNIRRSIATVPVSVPPVFREMRDGRTREHLDDWQRVVQGLINMGKYGRKVTLLHKTTTPGRWHFWDQVYATTRDPLSIDVLRGAGFSGVKNPEYPLLPADTERARRLSDRHYQSFRDLLEWLHLFPVDHYAAAEVSGVLLTGPPAQVAELVVLLQAAR